MCCGPNRAAAIHIIAKSTVLRTPIGSHGAGCLACSNKCDLRCPIRRCHIAYQDGSSYAEAMDPLL
jgi:hypothetical protein